MTESLVDTSIRRLVRLFAGAAGLPHHRGTLLEHLVGTWRILTSWGAPRSVARAGILHSCYSTSFYPQAMFDFGRRRQIRSAAGVEAEALCYRFCLIDRNEFWAVAAKLRSLPEQLACNRIDSRRPFLLSKSAVSKLLVIESANIAEQCAEKNGFPRPWMARVTSWLLLADVGYGPSRLRPAPIISEVAERRAIEKYSEACRAGGNSKILVRDAARLNALAGEPCILQAVCDLEEARFDRAIVLAARGRALLMAWGVPWDKRWNLGSWLNLADVVAQEALRGLSWRSSRRPWSTLVRCHSVMSALAQDGGDAATTSAVV